VRLTVSGVFGALAGANFLVWSAVSISKVWVSDVLLVLGVYILSRIFFVGIRTCRGAYPIARYRCWEHSPRLFMTVAEVVMVLYVHPFVF